jgi:hypothetical protein
MMDKLSIIFIQIMLWYNMLIKCDFSKGMGHSESKETSNVCDTVHAISRLWYR